MIRVVLADDEPVVRFGVKAVLGTAGEVVDTGRAHSLFSPAQAKRLWLRDRHCTYPGCDTPASWCDAHHLIHWADGGRSDLSNAALLCPRHHTTVHTQRHHGRLTRDPDGTEHVTWDRTPGAYDTALEHLAPDCDHDLDRASGETRHRD